MGLIERVQTSLRTGPVFVRALAVSMVLCGLFASARAGAPEYMKIAPRAGITVEVKGDVGEDGLFVASDIELLEKPRTTKIRASITTVDLNERTFEVVGIRIRVTDKTEFDRGGLDGLAVGKHVEVKCDVDTKGTWFATSVETVGVKSSTKIKGTVTGAQVDGIAPDTLSIDGLLILLVTETDVPETSSLIDQHEDDIFGDLARNSAVGMKGGIVADRGRTYLGVEYRHNVRTVSEFDLTRQFQSDQEDTQPELRVSWTGFWSKHVRTFVEARARKRYILASDLGIESGDLDVALTEAFVLLRDIAGVGLAVQGGRIDFDEPREWLYDEYLDAVRVIYSGSEFFVAEAALIHGVNPLKEKFETWTDVLAMLQWIPAKRNSLAAYALVRSDSDKTRRREPAWLGVRYLGDIRAAPAGFRATPWLEAAVLRGEDKNKNVEGRAFDVGTTVTLRGVPLWPTATVGYAFASGDETGSDDVDNTFRQTGYEDNNARMGGVTSVRYYGVALDPELSNLSVFTIGGGFRPVADSSLEVFYHTYRQDWADDKVRGDLVDPPARPNGVDTDIGWGADVVLGFPRLWEHVRASYTFGVFDPGDAFDPRQERAFLNKINLTVRF